MSVGGCRECLSCGEYQDENCFLKGLNKCNSCRTAYEMQRRARFLQKNGPAEAKRCSKCEEVLDASSFGKNRTAADGLQGWCKACTGIYMKKRAAGIKRKQLECCEEIAACHKCSEEKPIGQFSAGSSSRCKACTADCMRQRMAMNVHLRIRNALRARIWYALKRSKMPSTGRGTEALVGCSIEELKQHLEQGFKPGMTWSNWGRLPDQWEIDHIRPCKSFNDLNDPLQKRACFHYTNLQPLWMPENRSKSYLWDQEAEIEGDVV